jgi:hypothetical protein
MYIISFCFDNIISLLWNLGIYILVGWRVVKMPDYSLCAEKFAYEDVVNLGSQTFDNI